MTEAMVTIAVRRRPNGSWFARCPFCDQEVFTAPADAAPIPFWISHPCKGKR